MKTFIEAINNDIEKLPDKESKKKYNLTKAERLALDQLQQRTDIIITNADNGGAVVIQDTDEYIKEANRQLDDTNFYRKFDIDLTEIHCEKINHTIDNFKSADKISEKTASMIKTKNPKHQNSIPCQKFIRKIILDVQLLAL